MPEIYYGEPSMDGFHLGDKVTLLDIPKNRGMGKFLRQMGKVGVIKRLSLAKGTMGIQFPDEYELVYGFPWRFRKAFDFTNPDWEM